jgi:hypothetical protein
VRLDPQLAAWLDEESRRTGVARGRIIRQQLERARSASTQRFMRLAGSVTGPKDLSSRKGFSRG